jgi:hypothetical protein
MLHVWRSFPIRRANRGKLMKTKVELIGFIEGTSAVIFVLRMCGVYSELVEMGITSRCFNFRRDAASGIRI